MLCVVFAWVLFRSPSIEGALAIHAAMLGLAGVESGTSLWNAGLQVSTGWLLCAALGAVALWPRNSNELGIGLRALVQGRESRVAFVAGASATLIAMLILLNNSRGVAGAFIYFNF